MTTAINLQLCCSASTVLSLVPDWLRLHGRSSSGTPYNHPSWVIAWWRQRMEPGLEWRFLAGRGAHDELVAVLPLVRHPDGVVRFAGHDLHDEACALSDEIDRETLWSRALELLWQRGDALLDLPTLSDADSTTLDGLAPHRVHLEVYNTDAGARIVLPSAWDDYWSALPPKRRKRMRAERRYLERHHGAVRLDVVSRADALRQAVEQFWVLREASWQERGRYAELAGHVRGAEIRDFLLDLVAGGSESQLMSVARLQVAGQTAAAALLLRAGRRLWYSMCTFDLEFARIGPGRLLLAECVHTAIRDGIDALELGRGVEPYKFALGATRYELADVRLRNPVR